MLAEGALKCGAAVHRFSCVISHIFIVVLLLYCSPSAVPSLEQ
jgi:hypothetical protein